MPATNAWNEASPTGADFASSIDDFIRTLKLDIRERAAIDHVWNVSAAADGYHKSVTFKPSDNVSVVSMSTSPSLTGSNATNFFDLTQTWNTSGSPTFFKANITNTASGASALLMDLQVGGVSMFSVTKAGVVSDAVGSMATIRAGGLTVASAAAGDIASYSSPSQLGRVANAADATKFLNGAATPAFAFVKDSDLSTTDITTNNATTAKHGFLPKLSNSATQYLDGTGAFSVPGGGSMTLFGYVTGSDTAGTLGVISGSTIAISGFTALDRLHVVIVFENKGPTAKLVPDLYNSTDSVTILGLDAAGNGNYFNSDGGAGLYFANIGCVPATVTSIASVSIGWNLGVNAAASEMYLAGTGVTFTTNFTGSWNIALYEPQAWTPAAGDELKFWIWVYKIAGQ